MKQSFIREHNRCIPFCYAKEIQTIIEYSRMVKYELIVAVNQDGIIGITDVSGNQRIPSWSSVIGSVDMRHFRNMTTSPEGHILVMGRKTFDSLPNGSHLPGRIHVVLTRTPSKYDERYKNNEFVFFTDFEHVDYIVESLVYLNPAKRVFVCGGEEIYRALFPRCERLHITVIDFTIVLEEGETFSRFPCLDEIEEEFRETGSSEQTNCIFKTYDRNM